jgi:nucleoside-diphosphate-sugar epimerase
VVHLAGRVHQMDVRRDDPSEYLRANVEAFRHLLNECALASVRRVVLVSSVKAVGEASDGHTAWDEGVEPNPTDPYGRSKLLAEQVAFEGTARDGIEVVVIRSPMVYGPGGKGNFDRLVRLVRLGKFVPLPLAAIRNRRTLIYVRNLADVIQHVSVHTEAAGKIFFVGDGPGVSTPDIMRAIARILDQNLHLTSAPPILLMRVATLMGRRTEMQRLCESLELNISRIRTDTGWTPPFAFEQGLAATLKGQTDASSFQSTAS